MGCAVDPFLVVRIETDETHEHTPKHAGGQQIGRNGPDHLRVVTVADAKGYQETCNIEKQVNHGDEAKDIPCSRAVGQKDPNNIDREDQSYSCIHHKPLNLLEGLKERELAMAWVKHVSELAQT